LFIHTREAAVAHDEELIQDVSEEQREVIARLAELKEESRRLTAQILRSGDAAAGLAAIRIMCW